MTSLVTAPRSRKKSRKKPVCFSEALLNYHRTRNRWEKLKEIGVVEEAEIYHMEIFRPAVEDFRGAVSTYSEKKASEADSKYWAWFNSLEPENELARLIR